MTDGNDTPTTRLTLGVNGVHHEIEVPDDETLAATLQRLGFTSVRTSCGIGMCGTCTVQLDGMVVSSCLLLTRQIGDREVTTSEGLLTEDGEPSALQQAFLDARAYQCSFCIPGMVLTVDAFLRDHPDAGVGEVREGLAGNLCRCGTYPSILDAVRLLVHDRDGAGGGV